jgi:O-antigen/teichoic acid export membrane protein
MSTLTKLAKHSSHYFMGRTVLLLLGFVSFPLFARVLTVEQFGLMNLAMNIVLAAVTMGKVGMQTAVQRFHREHMESGDASAVRRYYSTIFFGTGLTGASVGVVMLLAIFAMQPLLPDATTRNVFLLASALVLIRALQSIVMNLLQAENRTIAYATIESVTRGMTIAAICLLLFEWRRSVSAYFVGTIVVEAIVVACVAAYVVRRDILSFAAFDMAFFKSALVFGFPLMLAEISYVILDSGDRVLVRIYLGPLALGYYAAVYGIAAYLRELITIPLNMALLPVCMETWVLQGAKSVQSLLAKSFSLFMVSGIGILAVLTLTAKDMVIILASRKYQPGAPLLPVLMAGLISTAAGIFFGIGLIIYKKTKVIATNTAIAAGLNVVLNIILLPRMGLQGAAWATLISFIVQNLLTAYSSNLVLPFEIEYLRILKQFALGTAVVVIGLRVQLANPWGELITRSLVALLFPISLWLFDTPLRDTAKSAFQSTLDKIRDIAARPNTA